MKPEIFEKMMRIIGRTGERLVIFDPKTEKPFVLMNLDEYERFLGDSKEKKPVSTPTQIKDLTSIEDSGIIEADSPLFHENSAQPTGSWVNEESAEDEDRYYIEPAE